MSSCKGCGGGEIDVSRLYCSATCQVQASISPDVLDAYHVEQDIRVADPEAQRDHYRAAWRRAMAERDPGTRCRPLANSDAHRAALCSVLLAHGPLETDELVAEIRTVFPHRAFDVEITVACCEQLVRESIIKKRCTTIGPVWSIDSEAPEVDGA